jgi:hypothetical protein
LSTSTNSPILNSDDKRTSGAGVVLDASLDAEEEDI